MTSTAGGIRARETQDWYRRYYARLGGDRNDLRTNQGVLFQTLALEVSVVRAVAELPLVPGEALVLDVGCGGGGDLYQLLRLGFRPENITGIDVLPERIEGARKLYPQIAFTHGDASALEFPSESFDLLFESTMFATLRDENLCARIAAEMVRVCKPGGHILLVDWRTPKPGDPDYKALTRRRLRDLFGVGQVTRLMAVTRGALVPPLGRFLSARLPSLYFLVSTLCPFLVGQVTYVLQKPGPTTT
jgi:ubiquinone/menaquinone biosynthesis C-methylase UbiE